MAVEAKRDWVPVAAIGVGAAALGVGIYFWTRKPPVLGAGDKVDCHFVFNHAGPGGEFPFRVTMGHTLKVGPIEIFEEMEETRQELVAPVEPSEEFDTKEALVTYQIPEVLSPDKYDIEASVRYPDGSIVPGMRVIADDIVVVEK